MKELDNKINELEQELQNLKSVKDSILKEGIKTQKEMEKILKDKLAIERIHEEFNNFTPSKEAILDIFDKIEQDEYKKYFGLKYISSCSDLGYENDSVSFGDGWKLECIERFGGCEGDGEEHYLIFKLTQHGNIPTYWYVPGYYQSYNGAELEVSDTYQCEPYQKTVTDYRPVN